MFWTFQAFPIDTVDSLTYDIKATKMRKHFTRKLSVTENASLNSFCGGIFRSENPTSSNLIVKQLFIFYIFRANFVTSGMFQVSSLGLGRRRLVLAETEHSVRVNIIVCNRISLFRFSLT